MKPTLFVTHPELFTQLHPSFNAGVKLDTLTAGSGRSVWWLGECGHEWQSRVQTRTAQGSGCPFCAGQKVLAGFNDLETSHPVIASQWHSTKNNHVTPSQVTKGSRKKAWWLGDCGHEWVASIDSRTIQGSGCPYCSGRKLKEKPNEHSTFKKSNISENKKDLRSKFPFLADQWDKAGNSEKASEVFGGGRKKGYWICDEGHRWEAEICKRIQNQGCPYCSGNKVLKGYNDLATTQPHLVEEWNFEKNKSTPNDYSSGSGKKVWWKCKTYNHEWEAVINSRVKGNNCPICSNYVTIEGVNSLADTHPELANEWHPTLNKPLTPHSITAGSGKSLFWVCSENHVWKVKASDRVFHNTHCPQCQSKLFSSAAEKEIAAYVKNLGFNVELNNRKLLKGKEIDIYIPEAKLAIEYNGLFWHSENAGKIVSYHYSKWLAAKEAGVQLLQIWEDDYTRNPDLVKRMVAHKLRVSREEKIYARETLVVELDTENARAFLDAYHIQGFSASSYYLGLKNPKKDEVVALLGLKKEPGTEGKTLNIVRYATRSNVVGGFTKLLKHAERTYQPEKFITFADHCVSDGGLYENTGFVADKELPPDYMYLVKGERKHKFGYRLKKFKDDVTLKYEEGLSERELAVLNNLPRIWDAGKTRYVKYVN